MSGPLFVLPVALFATMLGRASDTSPPFACK